MAKKPETEAPSLPTMEGMVPTKPKAKRGLDSELQAMARIDRILADLDGDQVGRVIHWLATRNAAKIYGPRSADLDMGTGMNPKCDPHT